MFPNSPVAAGNNSVLGKPYQGLRATSSLFGSSSENSVTEEEFKQTAAITPADVEPILGILMECPRGPYALRVFQQHGPGLCWQDSFFTMLFNSDWYKPILREDLSFYMEQFFANGENDLIYAKEVEVDVPNVSKFSQGIYDATIKQMQRKTEEKIKPIAVAFRDRSSDLGLPLAFWEYHCLALHRYLLLAYLFYKFPETIAGAHPERQTNLMRRRKSLGAANYSQLHVNYKEYVLRMLDTGMYCANFQKLRGWILAYIQGVSKGAHGLREFFDKSVAPAQIEGYYIGLDARHVVSLFKCGGSWFFYDIDVGCKELSAADSAALAKSRIVGIYFEAKNNGTFEYTFMLENDESVQLNMPFTKSQWNSGSSNPYQTIATGFSMIMVAESGAASASGGGKRRRRGAPRKTRRAKLSRRNTKRK